MQNKNNLLLKNGRVVDPLNNVDCVSDVLITDGRIAEISRNIGHDYEDTEVVDVSGLIVTPGLIDCHVHLREPGQEEKETIGSGSRAAAKGGFTTVICEPNTKPPIDDIDDVEDLVKRIEDKSLVNIYTKVCITKGPEGTSLTDIENLAGHGRVVALSDDGNPVLRKAIMEQALILSAKYNLPVSPHCEDSGFLSVKDIAGEELGFSPAGIFNNEANYILRDIGIAASTGCRLHFSHVSLEKSMEHINKWKGKGNITCEAAPQHLLLDKDYKDSNGETPTVNPPLRSKDDVQALRNGLRDGVIDVIASDHAPHTLHDKKAGAPGLIGLETTLGLVLSELVGPGTMSLNDAVLKMSTNPAKIFNIPGGSLLKGMPADVTIIDMNKEWVVDVEGFESKSRNCPFHGWKLKGLAVMAIVGGRIVMRDGVVIDD